MSKHARHARGGFRDPGELKVSDRSSVNKAKSAKQFRHNASRTPSANIAKGQTFEAGPMRGGWRL